MKASTPTTNQSVLSAYYRLSKPGIVYGNCLTAAAGFFLASQGSADLKLFLATIAGLAFIVASASAVNNYFDRGIDAKMARTRHRPSVSGRISGRAVLTYAAVLLILGIFYLLFYTNATALIAALSGWLVYVGLYTPVKLKTPHATLVGSIAGAVPPVVGYTAVTGEIDMAAGLLFFTVVFWQMPHFYSIAIYRSADYKAAGVPVLPLVKGLKPTETQILVYLLGFLVAAVLLTVWNYTGYIYLAGVLLVGIFWLRLYFKAARIENSSRWARQMFGFSLLAILAWSLLAAVGNRLP
jgi:protoheme IX farnesyltransferase